MTRFGFVPEASQSIPSRSTKSTLTWKSTLLYGKSLMKINCLLHQEKKLAVKLNFESVPNLGDKLVHLSMHGLVTSYAINTIYGFI